MRHVFPLSPDGAAADALPLLGITAGMTLTDLTATPRFGLKGPGAVEWFSAQGLPLPGVNRLTRDRDLTTLRLGARDITILGDPQFPETLMNLRARWDADPSGHSSWREEAWAWLRLTGPNAVDVMARLCAIDLRSARFSDDQIAQTRVANQDAILIRATEGFDLFFDIASSAALVRSIFAAIADGAHG